MKHSILCFALLLTFQSSLAVTPSLNNISQAQADAIADEFSANFVHTHVSGASSLGTIFGVEAGIAAGITDSPKLNEVSQSFDATAEIDKIPHLGVIAAASVPLGFTGEVNFIPSTESSGFSFEHMSYGIKWTFTQVFDFFLDMAVKVHASSSKLSFTDTINNSSTGNANVDTTIAYETSSFGYQLLASKKLLFVEPFIGLGHVSTETDITSSAATSSTVSIFSFSSAQSYSSDNSGFHFLAGVSLNLFLFKAAVEMSSIDGVKRTTGKLSFYF